MIKFKLIFEPGWWDIVEAEGLDVNLMYSIIHPRLHVVFLNFQCILGLQDNESGSGLLFEKVSVWEITSRSPPSHADTG